MKNIYYIKHPVNPLPYNLKIKYINNIINDVLTNNIDIKQKFIKLIQSNIINPTPQNVTNFFNKFIDNISNDILLKELNYLLKKISDIQIIGDNDIYITQKDFINNKFAYHTKKIQNLYQYFYTSSNDNVEYINISQLNSSSINYSQHIFTQLINLKKNT